MYIYLFLILAIATNEVDSFGRQKAYKPTRKVISSRTTETNIVTTSPTAQPVTNYYVCPNINKNEQIKQHHDDEPYRDCSIGGFGIVQKIPYHDQTLSLMNVPFSSACIRCGLCLVIADKINKTLMDVHDTMPPNRCLDEAEIDDLLRIICDQSFLRYRLREIDKERYIGESLPGSIIVESTANGQWAPKLKIKCNELLDGITTTKLYKYWRDCRDKNTNYNLATILCNGDIGVLRDCRSIVSAMYYPEAEEPFHAGVKFKAAFNCIG